ncbi:hypothetical protein [Mycobacteroides salmoniphilum]|uniref:Uncharacterized protein n=1 Tax=Mycobacteroides salmoniphilum TaxID=404941 RepID=A0A4R8T009_9MYCO|nr:hypothetical protein [Mycobacteroides salmoniphilum]TEA09151.1 hypothetical protein CCUG60884_00320 [Mycobacteroides salmoniphilum]
MKKQALSTKVRIDTHSPTGDIDVTHIDVETPTATDDLADWFYVCVYPHTDVGDGLAADGNGVSATATVVSSDCPSLRGESAEWG